MQARGLRDMANPGTAYDDPKLGKDPQGASMDEYVETQDDNGGVHLNSGIPNRAFHLAATAIGGHAWEGAGAIWYAALTGGQVGTRHRLRGVRRRDRRRGRRARRRRAAGLGDRRRDSAGRLHVGRAGDRASPRPSETLVSVRRTGGFAGRRRRGRRRPDLARRPRARRSRSLVDRIDLAHVAGGNPHPDMFVYDFNLCGRCAQVPEQHLTPDLDRLAVIVLDAGDPTF